MLKLSWWSFSALMVLFALGSVGCGGHSTIEGEVLSRVDDPNSTVTALVAREGGNATVAWVYRVYLQPTRDGAARELLRADRVDGLNISWADSSTLVIAMECGRVFAFQNFYDLLDKDGKLKKRVMVKLNTSGLCPESL